MTFLAIHHALNQSTLVLMALLSLLIQTKKVLNKARPLLSPEVCHRVAAGFVNAWVAIAHELTLPTKWPRAALAIKILLCASCYVLAMLTAMLVLAEGDLIVRASTSAGQAIIGSGVLMLIGISWWWMVCQAERFRVHLRDSSQ